MFCTKNDTGTVRVKLKIGNKKSWLGHYSLFLLQVGPRYLFCVPRGCCAATTVITHRQCANSSPLEASAEQSTPCWACPASPNAPHAHRPNSGKLLELSSLGLSTSKMGVIWHVTHRVVSGPSTNTKDVEWLCKLWSSLQCLQARMVSSRLKARHRGGPWLGCLSLHKCVLESCI